MIDKKYHILVYTGQGSGVLEYNVSDYNLLDRLIYWRNNFPCDLESDIYPIELVDV